MLVLVDFVVELLVDVDHTFNFYVLVCFLCLNVALPKFIELFQMKELKMLLAHLRQSPIYYLLHVLPELISLGLKFEPLLVLVVENSSIYPGHAAEPFFILLVQLIYLLNRLAYMAHHVGHQVGFGCHHEVVGQFYEVPNLQLLYAQCRRLCVRHVFA